MLCRWRHYYETIRLSNILHVQRNWNSYYNRRYELMFSESFPLSSSNVNSCSELQEVVFTNLSERRTTVYTHTHHTYYPMPETLEHRLIRTKTKPSVHSSNASLANENDTEQNKLINQNMGPKTLTCQRTTMPRFLFKVMPKVTGFWFDVLIVMV